MTGGPGDLYAAAQELLQAASECIDTAPGGHIDYQAVWLGAPSYDCPPALLVHTGGSIVADTLPLQPPLQPMQRLVQTGEVLLAAFTITVIRCVTVIQQDHQTIQLPHPADLSADAEVGYGDLWALWNGLAQKHRDGTLFQTPSRRREFSFDPAIPVRNSGGVGGWEVPVRVQLPGYCT